MRRVADRKHTTIGLGVKSHAAIIEPFHGVAGTEAAEWANQFLCAARVAGREFTGIKAGVGHIAPAATGDTDFGEEFWATFENGDVGTGCSFGAGDGSEESSRATADNDNSLGIHVFNALIVR